MRLASRIEKAEAELLDALLRRYALHFAAETGQSWEAVLKQLQQESQKYFPYVMHISGGLPEDEAAIRAAAARDGVDYDQLKGDYLQQEQPQRAKGKSR